MYQHGDVVATDAMPPFTKELQVYGLKLAARDDISDDYMGLVARTIAESFPRDAGLDAELQRELLANHYRYNALIPVPLGYDYSFMDEADEAWAAIERDNSVCDVIMQDVPQGQVMEVVEHILHYVTDIGLHYTFPDVWGISEDSELARAMAKAGEEGYYQLDQYLDIEDEEARFRVQMQEFAYWFITTAWNLQAPYGPVWGGGMDDPRPGGAPGEAARDVRGVRGDRGTGDGRSQPGDTAGDRSDPGRGTGKLSLVPGALE